MIRFACAAALVAAVSAASAQAGTDQHTVSLTFETGAPSGQVRVVLYGSEAAYSGGQALAAASVDAGPGPVVVQFPNLPAGSYAVKAFHDLDGDGRMKANAFGVPLEPYAFSNNAPPEMGPASWERARFTVDGDVAQTIKIH